MRITHGLQKVVDYIYLHRLLPGQFEFVRPLLDLVVDDLVPSVVLANGVLDAVARVCRRQIGQLDAVRIQDLHQGLDVLKLLQQALENENCIMSRVESTSYLHHSNIKGHNAMVIKSVASQFIHLTPRRPSFPPMV